MRATRLLIILFLCAGIAFLGLLAGGEHRLAGARGGGDPMAGYFTGGMPRYPGAEEIPAGRDGRVGRSKVKMAFFATEDEPGKVAAYYARAWREKRFFVRDDVTHRGGFVSAVDAATGLVYQVLLQAADGRTLVFPSETAMPTSAGKADAPAPLPLPQNSQVLITMSTRESGHDAKVHLSTNDARLEDNVAHFMREAQAAGWKLEDGKEPGQLGAGHHMLVYRHGDRELTIDLSLLSSSGQSRVRVHLLEVGP